MELVINWEVEDGYRGKSRPQTLKIDIEDYMSIEDWNSLSEEDKQSEIDQWVQEDFDSKVYFSVVNTKTI